MPPVVVRRPLRPGCHLGSGCIILLYGISFFDDPLFPHGLFPGPGSGPVVQEGPAGTDLLPQAAQPSLSALADGPAGESLFLPDFRSFQAVAYHMPFITHSWLFNEVLGFAPGIGMGWLWGRGLAMLFDIPTRGQQVCSDI